MATLFPEPASHVCHFLRKNDIENAGWNVRRLLSVPLAGFMRWEDTASLVLIVDMRVTPHGHRLLQFMTIGVMKAAAGSDLDARRWT